MPVPEESLFSLELVIDKLYIPHVVCRFPAVAFRLLDFPTFLVNHVEPELGDKIKAKISKDPSYSPPEQFSELQDNHGNYMVKKGKSCLFKTSVESLKSHLSNTPLYVMALDMFPEIPKLIGNSSVPLDGLMKNICVDIAKKGLTVPSVHGDKGLFKIYNLMGKEIGYIVLGFRLLCLGPSMAGHIPNKNVIQSKMVMKDEQENRENRVNVINVQPSIDQKQSAKISAEPTKAPESEMKRSQDMGSMTDAMKHDVLLQTIATDDKSVHVVISEAEKPKTLQSSISTQTEKKKRRNHHILHKDIDISLDNGTDDFLEEANIFCPPPLFYNKYAKPKLQIERPVYYTDEESWDDLSETGSVFNDRPKIQEEKKDCQNPTPLKSNLNKEPSTVQDTRKLKQKKIVNIQTPLVNNNTVFPVLTALLNELVGIQGTQGLENVIQRVGHATQVVPNLQQDSAHSGQKTVSTNVARPTLSSENKKSLKKNEQQTPQKKGWIRKTPQASQKPAKLTYRMTKTQKLRIAKSNPKWLQEKETIDEHLKPQEPLPSAVSEEDLNVTNFSDTLTEVRRLAEKELADETLDSIQDLSVKSHQGSPKQHKRKPHHKKKPKVSSSSSPTSPKAKSKPQSPSPSPKAKESSSLNDVKYSQPKALKSSRDPSLKSVKSSPSIMEHDETHPTMAVEPDLRRFVSPENHQSAGAEFMDEDSLQNSERNTGMEVHLPRAPVDDVSDDDVSLPDNDEKGRKMSAGLIERSSSFRESILGKSRESFDVTGSTADHGPLESTRTSESYENDLKNIPKKSPHDQNELIDSKMYQSTTDNDTRQFLSTEEPELQDLVSNGESDSIESPRYVPTFADTSSKPSVRSSMKFPVLNPISSEQSPIPATRKSMVKSDSRQSKASENASSAGSSKVPTPQGRRFPRIRESIHTESVSSYMPSDNDIAASLNSDVVNYSDDFQQSGSMGSVSEMSLSPDLPIKRIPSTKLGYTIS